MRRLALNLLFCLSAFADHTTTSSRATPKEDCLPSLGPRLQTPIKNHLGKPLRFGQSDHRPLLVVLANGDASREQSTQFLTGFIGRSTLQRSSEKNRILLLANLNEATEKGFAEISATRQEEYANVAQQAYAVADQVTPGLFNGLARRKAIEGATEVFDLAYPAIAKGLLAGGILNGGEYKGKRQMGANEEISRYEKGYSQLLQWGNTEIEVGFTLDLEPYAQVPRQIDDAIELSESSTVEALYRRSGRPRRRVWNRGAAGTILATHRTLAWSGKQAKNGLANLRAKANGAEIHRHLMGDAPLTPLQIAILAPNGVVMARYVEQSADVAKVFRDYQRFTRLLKPDPTTGISPGTFYPADPSCNGVK